MGNTLATKRRKNNKSTNFANASGTTNFDKKHKEDFRFIDGRRYHNVEDSKYPLPNDNDECDRLHMQHFIFRYAWQGNFAAPVEPILNGSDVKVLDSG